MNLTLRIKPIAALAGLCISTLFAAQSEAAVIFQDDFSGGTADLDGAAPDIGPGTWVASPTFNQDGSLDPDAGSATLAFAPDNGQIYQLDISLTGVSGDQNWIAIGFGSGQSAVPGLNNRFINGTIESFSLSTCIGAPARFVITAIDYTPADSMVTLTWDSREGEEYAVKISTDLSSWQADLDDGVEADPGDSTTRSFVIGDLASDGGKLFFRVERQ